MAYLNQLYASTKRGALVLSLVCSLLAPTALAAPKNKPAATGVSAHVAGATTRITIAGTAPMAYAVRRPSQQTLVVELPGVDASPLASTYRVASPLVSNVRVGSSLNNAGEPVPFLQVSLRTPARERSQLAGNNLVLELWADNGPGGAAAPAPVAAPTPSATPQQAPVSIVPTAAANTTQQSAQGQQYGQPGFVGEPINLNVVNADLRDILNYITEQYGVNFIMDKSVGAVPVTVNVTEVPWNMALDSILQANRLAISATGNILRVATSEVIASEASIQATINAARLNNAQLVTEFIRLNYARAVGTLAGAAGSTGAFTGGSTGSQSPATGGTGGDATGSSGEQGILPIISRRLSKRGSVEVDGRSNTLIITDVKENIDAIRQLVALLDQPEPQVEIETRIVIANRNFSRDLGVQLAAAAMNASRGSIGSFETLPNTNVGLQPFGIPGGVAGTPSSTNSLGANLASTVLSLTTGILGTSQISSLLTAAETKGQAKIVATPRVTALNNRPAQIEAGQQIPVVTPQVGAGGSSSLVFTTTFVSVPLRLSVTPQITDAGTVVLRLVVENNSINTAIAVNGTPGIDTQRMQTEVLVPDGGTTVLGGVLADNESDLQNRTPGLASIPLVGNMFKRKSVTRQTNEILFFITPRIFRPDYQGRPTTGTVSTSTRTATIPQPVPLGNPQSNTPPPGQTAPVTEQPTVARPDANTSARP